jgi:amino acid adenylation domain-containing protein/FkbM family methyltransferase
MQQEVIAGFQLSPQQEHLWLLQERSHGLNFRVQAEVRIDGELDRDLLHGALQAVVQRHEILRTSFQRVPGIKTSLQMVQDHLAARISGYDLTGFDPPAQRAELEELSRRLSGQGFDPAAGPVLKACLAVLSRREHALLLSLPALCSDRDSLINIIRETAEIYAAWRSGGEPGEEPLQYTVFSEWQNELLRADEAEFGREYWRNQTLSIPARTAFPNRRDRQADIAPSGQASVSFEIGPEPTCGLEGLARQLGVDLPDVLLTAWLVLLWHLTQEPEVLVSHASPGRTDEELLVAVGLFTRYLPLRRTLRGDETFQEAVAGTRAATGEAAQWQECFTWDAVSGSDAAFLPFGFDFRLQPPDCHGGGLTFSLSGCRDFVERFDLRLSLLLRDGALLGALEYDPALFDREDITLLGERYRTLSQSAVAGPDSRIGELQILGETERRRLVVDLNDTAADLEGETCLHWLVEEQVKRTPGNVAVQLEDQELTYADLDARADRLAQTLRRRGIGPDVPVAICIDRSLEMIVGILGILKAGGAYVPLDPAYPAERLRFLLEDSGAPLLLTVRRLAVGLTGVAAEVLHLDSEPESAGEPVRPAAGGVTPDNLAYVIYTSGSSGRPKGVAVPHRAIANRLLWMQERFPLEAEDRLLQKTSFSFDASIWEIFMPLFSGVRLVLARPEGHKDSAYLAEAIRRHDVTVVQFVPSVLQVMVEEPAFARCASLRRVFCGGEALPAELQKRFFGLLDADLHNLYGPTETSIDATSWPCRTGASGAIAPIGRPISNMQVFLLDGQLDLVPFGLPGELFIGGVGLARGYFGRCDWTAEKFVPSSHAGTPGARLYRSGDLARYQSDGAIEFLGRLDYQVKVRGFRIELGEIEAALAQHPAVGEAVVTARPDGRGEMQLVAYAAPKTSAVPAEELYRLPNGLEVAHLNQGETDWLFTEIFEERAYARYGVTVRDGDCVFDVGANIGLFSLYIGRKFPRARIYSFEPVPRTFEVLRTNVALHQLNARTFNFGLSSHPGEVRFTFYPKVSASSGIYADAAEDERVTRAFLRNQDTFLEEFEDELMAGRFESEILTCRMSTLSEVLREEGITSIDLLKIDVEKSELDVLQGIRDEDWSKIRQLVLEVHDLDHHLARIGSLLRQKGYEVAVEEIPLLKGSGLYNLYAVRAEAHRPDTAEESAELHWAPGPTAITPSELRGFLAERLPDYMVPAVLMVLKSLPRTPGGKVDRQALPDPKMSEGELGRDLASPRTPVEEVLVGIWREVLGTERIGLYDNFFNLGGHSLVATRMITRLREVFRVDIPLRSVFDAPRLVDLARRIEGAFHGSTEIAPPPLVPVPRDQPLALSFAQQRLWYMDQMQPGNALYNIPLALRLKGRLEPGTVGRAFSEIVRRHEILRTTIAVSAGRAAQAIAPHRPVDLPVIDLQAVPQQLRDGLIRQLATLQANLPFDLARGPLFRIVLLDLGHDEHVALLTMHHLISDGWSLEVLTREFAVLYQAFLDHKPSPLQALPIQYADFAHWQRQWLQGEALDSQLAYWTERLAGDAGPLELPADHPRPPVRSFRGGQHFFALPPALYHGLAELGRQERTTLFMVLLGAFQTLLYRYSGADAVSVGSPIANRQRQEVEDLIGCFVNTLVLRTDMTGNPTFKELLARVREVTLGAHAHQDLPFELLVEALQPRRESGATPFFNVWFVLQNLPAGIELPDLAVSSQPFERTWAQFDLILSLTETSQTLVGVFTYENDLFEAGTIAEIAGHFLTLLGEMAARPEWRLLDVPISQDEMAGAPAAATNPFRQGLDTGELFSF